jgi:hypothetical protein
MPEDEIITEETLPEESDGGSAVSDDGEKVSLKDILGKELGKTFASDEAAIKAVKDTFSYVGKKIEPKAQEIDTSQFVSKRDFEDALFLSQNKEYDSPEIKTLLNGLRGDGQTLSEVVKSAPFKSVYDKVKAYDESVNSKSVLHSNPRLSKATTTIGEAQEAYNKGDLRGAADKAVSSVIEAFEL